LGFVNPNSFFQQLNDFDANKKGGKEPGEINPMPCILILNKIAAFRTISWWQKDKIIYAKIQKCLANSNKLRKTFHEIVHEVKYN